MTNTHKSPTDDEKTLSPKQLLAVPLLAKGVSIAQAAKTVGCDEKSIDKWKKQPAFKQAISDAESEIYEAHLASIKRTMGAAIVCLARNMSNDVSAYVQVQSASKLLDLAIEIGMRDKMNERLDDFEERLKDAS